MRGGTDPLLDDAERGRVSGTTIFEFRLQALDAVHQNNELLAEPRQSVFHAWRHFGICLALEHAETHELPQAFIEHFFGKARNRVLHRAGPAHTLAHESEDGN